MPRPKQLPHLRFVRDSFSGPAYVIMAARLAAGVAEGKEFAPWLVAAMMEKVERENPGLLAETRAKLMPPYPERADQPEAAAAEPKGAKAGFHVGKVIAAQGRKVARSTAGKKAAPAAPRPSAP